MLSTMGRRLSLAALHWRPMVWIPRAGAGVRSIAFLVCASVLVGGCTPPGEPLSNGVEAINETQETIHFKVVGDDGELFALTPEFEPGEGGLVLSGSEIGPDSLVTEDGCTTGDLVALDTTGTEVARHPPPLCDGDVFIVESGSLGSGQGDNATAF